ncbi:damage-control phosphatase ARMT1 family protein [Aerosakkonema funiforme]|uniref:Protein-glutamate O-methyltransferase family protein n=1 Tax=Aerosakkonema funiforme FACHB-1375 TaxID=2949571 RepID=A0A926VL10_9CYAN|nr:damage-control phosphatase ARMT1 family protein [Aerosakkonema funiforme]MBD2185653.1 protein-glutamate O-methyltransferase family protein [Aerosakkonema funiforme FACHB-1375]
MKQRNFPDPELMPPPIKGSDEGSFAHSSVAVRLGVIAKRVIAENDFTPEIVENLEKLIQEIPYGLVRPLQDTHSPDLAAWTSYLEPFQNCNWLEIPWYFAEAYFYRRILEATHYFQPGRWQAVDPFEYQKNLGLSTAIDAIAALSNFVNNAIQDIHPNKTYLKELIYFDLWGNRADMSLWPAGEVEQNRVESEREKSYILADDTSKVADRIASFSSTRIDFIIDNAGFELIGDLCIADFLLTTNAAGTVYFHLKAHPTFVSDATIKDVIYTTEFLAKSSDRDVKAFALRLKNYIANNRLKLREHLFWTSPLPLWEMPDTIVNDLARSHLIFLKGDANYRRSMGDRHWPFTTPYGDIVSYFPAPLVALRTLKSELAAGLQTAQIEMLNHQDPDWLTNGQWGVIQFVDRS